MRHYRVVTLAASLGSVWLTSISLAFLVTSVVQFRAEDFFNASATKDYTTLGTCVGTLTHDQLSALDYNNHDIDCKKDTDQGNRFKLLNTLAVSVHGVYYAYHTESARLDPGDHIRTVLSSMVTHVLGKQTEFYPTPETVVPPGLNFSTVFKTLSVVAELAIPVSCDEIYGITFDSIESNPLLVAYIDNIREGRLDDDKKIKSTWPLVNFETNCQNEDPSEGVDYVPAPNTHPEDPLTAAQKAYMHAHCTAQFQFASVGNRWQGGTGGVPIPGITAGPYFYPYAQADGFNHTSSYTTRARMYVGQRFGLSIWAYVPMFLATCFLLADSLVFFLAEALMPIIIADQVNYQTSTLNGMRDSLVTSATSKSSRQKRLAIGATAVAVSITFYAIFIAAPWGFFYSSLPRPICEVLPDGTGAKAHHNVPDIGWMGTDGGWKSDYDATWYDLAALFIQIFVLFLLPITTTGAFMPCNNILSKSTTGRNIDSGMATKLQLVHNSAKYRFTQQVLVAPMVVGILIALVGQSISGARFGMAWAEGVVAQERTAEGEPLFDEVQLSEDVYDQTIATLALVVSCGLVFAVALQRHLINGVGCFSTGLFVAWVVLVTVFALPLMFYAASRSIFVEHKANEDCSAFPRDSHETENNLCIARFWTLLVGGGLFVGAILVMTALGFVEAFPSLFVGRNKATVMSKPAVPLSDALRNTTVAPGAPYYSDTEPFFNHKHKFKATSNTYLYGTRLASPRPHS